MAKHYSKFTNNYTKIYYKGNLIAEGSRDPLERIQAMPIDFKDKTLLDLGCNCGGTMFAVADQIKQGWGCDINPDAISFANNLAKEHNIDNVSFSVADLNNWQKYNLPKTDILFALAIAKWVPTWREIITHLNPKVCVFEAHGKGSMVPDQVAWLTNHFKSVEVILDGYEAGKRRLYLCVQ
jgi:2-polyprenyl-3-methyl-5-hydroxy-6-metoxy-1,4-benzoquinol methylase